MHRTWILKCDNVCKCSTVLTDLAEFADGKSKVTVLVSEWGSKLGEHLSYGLSTEPMYVKLAGSSSSAVIRDRWAQDGNSNVMISLEIKNVRSVHTSILPHNQGGRELASVVKTFWPEIGQSEWFPSSLCYQGRLAAFLAGGKGVTFIV